MQGTLAQLRLEEVCDVKNANVYFTKNVILENTSLSQQK